MKDFFLSNKYRILINVIKKIIINMRGNNPFY